MTSEEVFDEINHPQTTAQPALESNFESVVQEINVEESARNLDKHLYNNQKKSSRVDTELPARTERKGIQVYKKTNSSKNLKMKTASLEVVSLKVAKENRNMNGSLRSLSNETTKTLKKTRRKTKNNKGFLPKPIRSSSGFMASKIEM